MKTTAKLRTYYHRQIDTIDSILQKQGHPFTPEDFHILRLSIKKIKAILSFLRFYDPDFRKEKYFEPFETIFRQAGEVREIQIQQTLLNSYASNPLLEKYFAALAANLLLHQANFSDLIDRKLRKKIKSNARKVDAFFRKAASRLMDQYLKDERSRIDQLLKADKLQKKEVHALRKQIKDIYYLQKIFQPRNKRLVIADEFQEMLGQWHDYRVIARDLLKGAQNHKLLPQEVKALMSLRKNILARAERLLVKIELAKKSV
jgi:CHAD domain